jgi:DNA-binding MarR family transcriptional regulator
MPDTREVSEAVGARSAARVGYLIARAERAVRAPLDELTPTHRLSTPKYTALSVLQRRPGLSSAELARASFVTPQAMHPFVLSMESDGLIQRRPDPDNRRILRITLTRRGEAALRSCERDVDALEDRALRGLSVRDVDTLRRLLRTVAHNLEQPDPCDLPTQDSRTRT